MHQNYNPLPIWLSNYKKRAAEAAPCPNQNKTHTTGTDSHIIPFGFTDCQSPSPEADISID